MVTARAQAKGLNASEAEDCAADVLAHLATRSIPRYRPKRGTMAGYLNACAMNQVTTFLRGHVAARRRNPRTIPGEDLDRKTLARCNPVTDRRLDAIAHDLAARPERYLTPRQAVVLRAVRDRPKGVTLRQVSRELGYGHPSHLSHILKRIRTRLAGIARATAEGDGQGIGQRRVDLADPRTTDHDSPDPAHADQPRQRTKRPTPRRRAT